MQNNNIFIDKKKELAKITAIGNALSNHRGAIIKLHGEVGTGKTLLIHTYNQSITYNHEIIYCRCLDSIFSAELTPLLNFAKVRSNEIASHLDNNSDLTTLFKKLLDFFMNRKKPIIIVIEDIQWANSSILNLLNYFARRLVFSRCMLIISYRTSNITNDHRLHQSLKHVPNNLVHDLHLSTLSRESIFAAINLTCR